MEVKELNSRLPKKLSFPTMKGLNLNCPLPGNVKKGQKRHFQLIFQLFLVIIVSVFTTQLFPFSHTFGSNRARGWGDSLVVAFQIPALLISMQYRDTQHLGCCLELFVELTLWWSDPKDFSIRPVICKYGTVAWYWRIGVARLLAFYKKIRSV